MCCFACNDVERPPKPNNLINKEKMVDVLYDVYIMNAAKGLKKKQLEKWGISPEKYILNKYKIDSLQFAQSNEYYAYDLETYQEMMDEVVKRLEKEKAKYQKQKDSIQKEGKKKKEKLIDTVKNTTPLKKENIKLQLKN